MLLEFIGATVLIAGAAGLYAAYAAPNADANRAAIAGLVDDGISSLQATGERMQAVSQLVGSLSENLLQAETRETSAGDTVRIRRKLSPQEVKAKGWESEKQKAGYDPTADIYVDENGNHWIGHDQGPLDPWP